MATVTVVRYKRRKRLGDDKSPMMYLLKPKAGESKIYSIDSLAQEIESIGSLSVEDVSHVMKSFVRAMKKVLVAGNKVKVDGLRRRSPLPEETAVTAPMMVVKAMGENPVVVAVVEKLRIRQHKLL